MQKKTYKSEVALMAQSRTGGVLGVVPSAAVTGAHKKADFLVVAVKAQKCTFILKKFDDLV